MPTFLIRKTDEPLLAVGSFKMENNQEEEEIWKDVIGYEGLYQISTLGNVKALKKIRNVGPGCKSIRVYPEKIMRPSISRDGYSLIGFRKDGLCTTYLVHRLIALHFIPNPENKPQVNHINGVKTDNTVVNLEWVTVSENGLHSYKNGLQKPQKGKDHVNSKPLRQLTLEGELVRTWESCRQVERTLGYPNTHINACCNGKIKHSRGYKWEFI